MGQEINGALDLNGASVDTLHDDEASWPSPGNLLLNRCLYNALIGGPMDARRRLAWLARQAPERWGEDFWPQPYEQLAHVFREMGMTEDARAPCWWRKRPAARRPPSARLSPSVAIPDPCQGQPARRHIGLWHRPLLSLDWLLLFWGLGVVVFAVAQASSAIKPNSPVVLRSPEWTMCRVARGQEVILATGPTAGRAAPGQTSSIAS